MHASGWTSNRNRVALRNVRAGSVTVAATRRGPAQIVFPAARRVPDLCGLVRTLLPEWLPPGPGSRRLGREGGVTGSEGARAGSGWQPLRKKRAHQSTEIG